MAKTTSIVPGKAVKNSGQINVADYASQIITNPSKALTPSTTLSGKVPNINENAAGTVINNVTQAAHGTGTAAQGTTTQAAGVDPQDAASYDAQTTQDNIAANGQATAQQGTVSDQALIDAEQLDMQGTATGVNADGSINYTGQALQDYASQDLNEVDPKATMKGQLEALQSEFVDPNTGEPRIPAWAAATARNVSKIAAFAGMSGSAATAAMAQALMEASLPIAQQDAQFFQTLTLQNLSNKQASILNKANVLANFDMANLDARMTAAVENSKAFLAMDLKNLDNRQQTELINTQARVQSILEDAKAVNAQRMFTADSQNDMTKFYDQLGAQINQFNASQANSMEQFNTSETNSMSQFNLQQELAREQFYKEMQYNIDVSNANWRRDVTMKEADMKFEAAATDVKNAVGISTEMLNQIWDRSDSLLDYLWKSTENAADRANALKLQKNAAKTADNKGLGGVLGSVAGTVLNDFLY